MNSGPSANPVSDRSAEVSRSAAIALLHLLEERGYRFVTPSPTTHRRYLERHGRRPARTLRDMLGWSLPFARGTIDEAVETLLIEGGFVDREGLLSTSRIRVSCLHGKLYLHSAFPTHARDAVFFGPDSYRFADLIAGELTIMAPAPGARFLDIGTGAGVGAMVAAQTCPGLELIVTDVNAKALAIAEINLAVAGLAAAIFETDTLGPVPGAFDIITANPPYIVDAAGRAYRDGGDMHGGRLSLMMAEMALPRLAPGGCFILYTGSAIVAGRDELRAALIALAGRSGLSLAYRERDPDVFGEELEEPAYRDVERIAVISAIFRKPA